MSGEPSIENTVEKLILSNKIKKEVIPTDIKDDYVDPLTISLEAIKEEILEDPLLGVKDPPLQLEVQPLTVNLNEFTKKDPEPNEIHIKYPIDEPGCSSWNEPDPSKEVVFPEPGCSNPSLLDDNKVKLEPPDLELKQEEPFSDSDNHLSFVDDKSLIEDEPMVPKIKPEEIDLDLKDEDQLMKESDLPGILDVPAHDSCDHKTKVNSQIEQHMDQPQKNSEVQHAFCVGHLEQDTRTFVINDGVFQCEHCDYNTEKRGAIKLHVLYKHTPSYQVELYTCNFCRFKSKSKDHLKVHISNTHKNLNEADMFKCEHCNYKTENKRYLIRHVYETHTKKTMNLQCTYCGYKAKCKRNLDRHVTSSHGRKRLDEVKQYREIRPKSLTAHKDIGSNESNL